jgi:hypothetical protein
MIHLLLAACGSDYPINIWVEETLDTEIVRDEFWAVDQALDLLLVVDESGSMSVEQHMLKTQLPNFLLALDNETFTSLDWQVGISSAAPHIRGSYGWVSKYDENPQDQLAELIDGLVASCQGPDGEVSKCERGLDATLISYAWDREHRKNSADLLVVWVSDEPDQSINTPESYLTQAALMRSKPFKTMHTAIVYETDQDLCWEDKDRTLIGRGYIEAADMVLNLCEPDMWPDAINLAAQHLPTINTHHYLSRKPVQNSDMNVYVEDRFVSPELWEYHPRKSMITLDWDPVVGSHIEVLYQVERSY